MVDVDQGVEEEQLHNASVAQLGGREERSVAGPGGSKLNHVVRDIKCGNIHCNLQNDKLKDMICPFVLPG